uniref:uncharacterized protein LOC122582056 n=1 Tax=Erigeron canadensis TaxID=72917 RepID=UPI001CB8FEF5|nr:uncharacterized protein LOC122582056 [Erigeron canadensis]
MATNGGKTSDAAAARRRRIAERGAERLALITGRVQSLSSPSVPPSDQLPLSDENTDSPLSTKVVVKDVMSNVKSVTYENTDSPLSTEAVVKDVLSNVKSVTDENTDSPVNVDAAIEDLMRNVRSLTDNLGTTNESFAQISSEPNKIQSFPNVSTEQGSSSSGPNNSQKPRSQTRLHEAFTPSQLRRAITASESIRRICCFAAAFLVLLSYAGFPILGNSTIKNIILTRPLFLLILTNITIVIAPPLLEKVKQKEHRRSSTGEAGFANHVGTILEWGLVMKTGSSALFMDCSIYSLVVICGMSFLQFSGW